jgi:hypothetical protein
MTFARLAHFVCWLALMVLCFNAVAVAQTETATISGLITDDTGAVVPGAEVKLQSVDRGSAITATTNNAGIYVFASVHPGPYQLTVHKPGFKQVDFLGLIVNVQDHIEQNFRLQVGSVAESVTVEASAATINTTDATVSTVVDRNFAENLPMNGRSFQTLINLTPGVVLTPITAGGTDSGQFSVNGQRASANYWMVDGVSANVGSSTSGSEGQMPAGAAGTTSVLGGTNSLVSVDALQEFRIQTSTFAPEFGRTPGAQISIVTRSGGNQFHGAAFDYLRNDIFDANNWFNGYTNNPPLAKAKERQNDFGGTFSGPIIKDRTFFFFSYEGLRLRLPNTAITSVPDLGARQNALPATQPYLNAYPLDSKQPDLGNGIAQFNASYSDPATLDAYSLRIDHRVTDKISLFGRYNFSPSEIGQRAVSGLALNSVVISRITVQTATIGLTLAVSPRVANELRFNYSRTNAFSNASLDSFGGAVPLTSLGFPSPFTAKNSLLLLCILSLQNSCLEDGANVQNLQRQINLVDNVSVQKGSHNLRFGVDYRRLSPIYAPLLYEQLDFLFDVPSAENGNLGFSILVSNVGATLLFHNLSAFGEDTWRIGPQLTLTYGLRWDNDFAPSTIGGPPIAALSGFSLTDFSRLALAPAGTPAFKNTYGNVAPRFGLAYQLSQRPDWGTVIRGGFGVFYDLATSETATLILRAGYPFSGGGNAKFGGTFPQDPATATPPPIEPPNAANQGSLGGFDPNFKLPYTLQWNVALEQGIGRQQSLSVSYIGAAGRRLIQTTEVLSPNPNIGRADLLANTGTSNYQALQLQFQRRLLHGLQVLSSYTWSHSIDTGSAGSVGDASNELSSARNPNANRGSSDFDIRHAVSAGITYEIPALTSNSLMSVITRGWSLQSIIQARSAPPIEILDNNFTRLTNGFTSDVRPDVVQGIPLYLYGPQYPGGKAINNTPGAVAGGCPDGSVSVGPFCPPPTDVNGNPIREGNLGRNVLRAFGLTQWNFGVHRDFRIHDSLSLQFRAEMFNLLNHPNFAPPVGDISVAQFGLSTQTYGQYLSGGTLGAGGFSPLYQIGGPRSVQFGLRLSF